MKLTAKQQVELRRSVKLFNIDGYKLDPFKLDLRTANSLVKKGLVEKHDYCFFILTTEGLAERNKLCK